MSNPQPIQPVDVEPSLRIVNINIPLKWAVTGLATGVLVLVQNHFTTANLVQSVGELKIAVNSGNTAVTAMQQRLTILEFRLEAAEASMRSMLAERGKR